MHCKFKFLRISAIKKSQNKEHTKIKWATTWQNQQNECVPSEDSDQPGHPPVYPAKTQISLGIHPVWSESSLYSQWVAKGPMFLHADSKDSDQTGRMPRLIWIFAGCTLILLVLSCRGSYVIDSTHKAEIERKKSGRLGLEFVKDFWQCYFLLYRHTRAVRKVRGIWS